LTELSLIDMSLYGLNYHFFTEKKFKQVKAKTQKRYKKQRN